MESKELPKKYDPAIEEPKWQKFWEDNKIYRFDPDSDKPIYSIDTPPPYASAGHLHVGHALHYTQFEIIARFRRMAGFNVYFPPCFDNNGLPTEKYVEEKFKISKKDTTRADFRKLCMEESRKVEKAYADRVFRALGHSYDWYLLYTTIDPEAQKVAQTSFLKLVKQGDAYRAEEPTLWCPYHQTALAQAEVEDVQRTTKLNHIYFDLEDGCKIEIATTRPEFLAACVGIFVHPDDERNKHLIGKNAIVPLFGQKVPIMSDEKVDREFGSGIVMICTFGDKTDIEWWKTHKLPLVMIVNPDGTLNEKAGKYQGMKLDDAKQAAIEDLEKQGKLIKQEDLQQNVGGCWRCSNPVEFIVTKQWFIKALDYKKEIIETGNKVRWHPEFYRKRFEDWTNNLGWDWCISRQRFFGVPIPAWYCRKCGKTILPEESELPVDPTEKAPDKICECGSNEVDPEYDVFDTWMTSSMSPEIAVRWLEKPESFDRMFPVNLRPQSHDIIRTWAFYTILKSFLHFRKEPWKDIAIGTFVLDPKGRGMSKSKGNVVWTEELLKKYNVDVVRYWIGNARWGTDLMFQDKELVAGQKFLTKLWNATKFSIMHLQDFDMERPDSIEPFDAWMLSKLNSLVRQATADLYEYRTGEAKRDTEMFFWNTFCDNYLEIIKDRLYNAEKRGEQARRSAQYTLYQTTLAMLKMMAPVTPHITEALYHLYYSDKEGRKSIHISEWPAVDESIISEDAEKPGELAIDIISAVRRFKADQKVSIAKECRVVVECKPEEKAEIEKVLEDLKATIKAADLSFSTAAGVVTDRFNMKLDIDLI